MKQLPLFTLCFCICCGIAPCDAKDITTQRPNVIVMMADDLATEDLSCCGSTRIKTPNIDMLASQGTLLTSYYAGNPVCSPSRMALLSGAYPARLGWRWGVLGYGFPAKTGMSEKVYTLAEAFRDAGYRTAITGKWHLGERNMAPENQGFESAYYIRMSNNQNRDMFRDSMLVKKDWDNRLLSETFAQEAIRVIEEDNDAPFFLYVPWSAPHFPADPHPDWHGNSGEDKSAKYTDVVEELDDRVGQILDALDAAGKAENTIVVFTSDNGRQKGQQGKNDNPRYSGMKWQSLEGGTRVPCIVRFPDKVPAGKTNDALIAAIDLFPTLIAACGLKADLPDGAQKIDGINLWPVVVQSQAADTTFRNELLYWHGKGQATAIRVGQWKLFFNDGDENPQDPAVTHEGPVLFNLNEDIKETKDVSTKHPEVVRSMLDRAREILTDVYSHQVPIGTWTGIDPPNAPLNAKDVWGKWIR